MVKTILAGEDEKFLDEAVDAFRAAKKPVALTGAGISVESGIPDFRSPGGLWTRMAPEEYATIEVFLNDPEKAWKLYRAIAESLEGAKPNPAHLALAELERAGMLSGIVTQNVDGLHHAAGSEKVIEMHGDHRHLHCLQCRCLFEVVPEHFNSDEVPCCMECDLPLKPNAVLFGEDVRGMEEIIALLSECDLLLVIGTSAQVYPAAGLPAAVKQNEGLIFEFNLESTALTRGETAGAFIFSLYSSENTTRTDYFFKGFASETLSTLAGRLK
ncbi:MAG: SIR2 family NAD-dependent protein deacylase [Planctomycetota bacterium]|jgi:NAD-dependent deacetylase